MIDYVMPPMHKLPGGWVPSHADYTESGISIYRAPQYSKRYLSGNGPDKLVPNPLIAQQIIP